MMTNVDGMDFARVAKELHAEAKLMADDVQVIAAFISNPATSEFGKQVMARYFVIKMFGLHKVNTHAQRYYQAAACPSHRSIIWRISDIN